MIGFLILDLGMRIADCGMLNADLRERKCGLPNKVDIFVGFFYMNIHVRT